MYNQDDFNSAIAEMNNKLDQFIVGVNTRLERFEKFVIAKQRPFLPIKSAASYLGVPLSSMYGYAHKKAIKTYKLRGRRLYFDLEDLNNFILNQENLIPSQAQQDSDMALKSLDL
jgi:excisionase family DNA binding protein